jgi:hypothetical protein
VSKTKNEFHLTPAIVVRLLIFTVVISSLIYYLSQSPASSLTIDPTLSIDEDVRSRFLPKLSQIIPESDIIIINQKLELIKTELAGFPKKQADDLKKSAIQSIYDDLMNK